MFTCVAREYESPQDPLERAWRRIVTPAAKSWICKRTLGLEFTGECREIWGGNGYVENAPMARMYRDAPVNSICEGSGNVMCLDVLRAIERELAKLSNRTKITASSSRQTSVWQDRSLPAICIDSQTAVIV